MDSDKNITENQEFDCDICGSPMLNRHCRFACLQCGYTRDCCDP